MADPSSNSNEASATGSDAGSNTPNDVQEEKNQDTISVKTTTDDLFGGFYSQFEQNASKSKEHKLGLDINYPWGWSKSPYASYDVVTVHGIRDDYKTAWIDQEGTWWVREQLFNPLSAREIDYSYEIDEDSTLYEPNGITLHAERLVTKLAEVRKNLAAIETNRPIVWVCHDLGGTIVKKALSLAINQSVKYGKIYLLTTAIIFLGTPHRFKSMADMEDQLHKLILLPGPEIKNGVLSKVRNLARQVDWINQAFLATKLLDRAVVFNIFTQNIQDSLRQQSANENIADSIDISDKDDIHSPVTPFTRYAHFTGQSFEAAGRIQCDNDGLDHVDLIQGDEEDCWCSTVSSMFNAWGFTRKVSYLKVQFHTWLLSLAPPTRALDIPFDPVLPEPPVVKWIYEHERFKTFSRSGTGSRLLHLHCNVNSSTAISEVSRLFYVSYDADTTSASSYTIRSPNKTVVYFEFDRHDSRYNTISSMLTYLINIVVWRFWNYCSYTIEEELEILGDTRAWSLEDLYHLYSTLRLTTPATQKLTIFISCFDQCPEDQRQWFLEHVLEEQSYSETEYRMIISTCTRDNIDVKYSPCEASINLSNCPTWSDSRDKLTVDFQLGLAGLIERRQIYENFRPQLDNLLEKCSDAPYLGHIILTWLGSFHRGKPKSEIADIINQLSPPTAENVVQAFISHLAPELQPRAKNVFNWVKHSSEPWSPESLTEALAVYEFHDTEPSFNDLDIEGTMRDIEEAFGGIITVKNRDVKFSHASFYDVPEVGIEGSTEERRSKVNSMVAEICLRYLQLKGAREELAALSPENFEGGPWATSLDAVVICHPRTTMAEYAVRFWPQHYKASGQFKPRKLVHELFASKESRAAWEVPFWLLSNPFTRIRRSYMSPLPVFAMLGLEDLVDEKLVFENRQTSFEKDCWFAITEAARVGNKEIVQKLLGQVTVDEKELKTALLWAAAQGSPVISNALVKKIPNLRSFQWPQNITPQAVAAGLDSLLATILQSGCDINKTSNYWKAPLVTIAAWRDRVSTMRLLLNSEPKPDLTIKDIDGNTAILRASQKGNPHMIEILLRHHACLNTVNGDDKGPVQIAVEVGKYKALNILITAGAGSESVRVEGEPLLVHATSMGFRECVSVLLSHKPMSDMDLTPLNRDRLLIQGVCTGSTELVALLIKHGVKVDFVDPNEKYCKTPLLQACKEGDLDMVKLLLKNEADINYTGDASDTPLFTAIYRRNVEVSKYLLQDEKVDVMWTNSYGMTALHVAADNAQMIPELLKRGTPIDGHSSYGTVLHLAAKYNFPKSVKALLEHNPKPQVDYVHGENGQIKEEIGCTPLQLACKHTAPKCVKLLLEAGADPNFKNKNGEDAVDILLRTGKRSRKAQQCLKLLLSRPYNLSVDHINEHGQTRLHNIGKKTAVIIVQSLIEARASLNSHDKDGYTPLAVAVKTGNEEVARYFIEQGASTNAFGPRFGSILHLAVASCSLGLVKLLVNSGADREAVDPEYGDSLLYTAITLQRKTGVKGIVRYLVDEARVPLEKMGGELGYPILRAADPATTYNDTNVDMIKFLIRRKAQLNVADRQGRRAVHIACRSSSAEGIRALVEAGADVDVKDRFGRMPIHFAASSKYPNCLTYLLNKFKDIDINVTDHDNWTPLLWAARSRADESVDCLIERNADIWIRGRSYGVGTEWSALKLMNFANDDAPWPDTVLELQEHVRINRSGEREKWDDPFHRIAGGHHKFIPCQSCLLDIIGIQWQCIECIYDFSLCFKCYGHRSDIHDPKHSFEEIGPLYDETPAASTDPSMAGDSDAPELPREVSDDEGQGLEQEIADDNDSLFLPEESLVGFDEEFDLPHFD